MPLSRLAVSCSGFRRFLARGLRLGATWGAIWGLSLGVAIGGALPAAAQELQFFRIGTGPVGEMHFSVGGIVANALSNPPGARQCDRGGSCGVPGMIAVAVATNGSLDNIDAIAERRLHGALSQADIAYWAYHGTGIYAKKGAINNLRGVAMLYHDSLHLVVRADSKIMSVKDLKGKKVAIGDEGSGVTVHSGFVLKAYGLSGKAVKTLRMKPGPAADALAAGEIDAFFTIDSAPSQNIADLAARIPVRLLPIDGKEAEKMRDSYPFLLPGTIAADTYPGIEGAVTTLDLGVVLLVGAEVPQETVYGITKALWHPSTQKILRNAHPNAINLEAATDRLGIQLHSGAAAYYFDAGVAN